MCGIAGIYTKKQISETIINNVMRMGKAIHHRGPDDEGFFSDNNVAFIHKRLSIIDLKTGHQPIFNEDKSIVVIYNGEIYNYLELRAQLIKKGHIFKTYSDTEVIVHSYEEYGIDCVHNFNGMFSFALWDSVNKQLFISRDRIGIKPFYYYKDDNYFIFASEIKAIVSTDYVKAKLNDIAFLDYLTFQNLLDDKTFFMNIHKLLPGYYGIIDNSKVEIKQYWDVNFTRKTNISFEEAVEEYSTLFPEAVKRHTLSDVPIGSYLSGGFDSPTVAYYANQFSNSSISTFTGAFDEGFPFDERPLSRLIAKSLNSNMYEVEITPSDFEKLLKLTVYHLDEPSVGSGALPQYIVSRLVSKYVKVVLTGHGGDELFSGYPVFKAHFLKRKLTNNILNIFSKSFRLKFSEIFHILYFNIFPLFINKDVKHGLFIMFDNAYKKKLLNKFFFNKYKDYNPISVLDELLKDKPFFDEDKLTYLHIKTYLPTLLLQEDKVGMAHSIEARMPYCDNNIIDFSNSLYSDIKLYNSELKCIPKTAMKGVLPEEFYNTSKKGFPTPIAKWFRTSLKNFVKDTLLNDNAIILNYFDKEQLTNFLNRFYNYKTVSLFDYAMANRIYSLLTIEFWFQNFLYKI